MNLNWQDYAVLRLELDLQYTPTPSMRFKAGVMLFEGTDGATLGAWRDNDLAFAEFSYSF